jgi:hypothetical protein
MCVPRDERGLLSARKEEKTAELALGLNLS